MELNNICKLADVYDQQCQLIVEAFIKKLPNGKYRVLSEKGKNLGTYPSRSQAKKRLSQIEMFKHMDKQDVKEAIDLTDLDELSYSALMRELNKKVNSKQLYDFMKIFKDNFDLTVKKKIQKPEKVALQNSIIDFNKIHKIKLNKELLKNAAITELGNAKEIGKYLSDIVKFTIAKMPVEKRLKALTNLKNKFSAMPENEIASKHSPDSAAIGQSITFVKHVLFNHDPQFIRAVLNSLAEHL